MSTEQKQLNLDFGLSRKILEMPKLINNNKIPALLLP